MYLGWLGEASTRAEVADVVLGAVAGELLALDPLRLTIDVWDPDSDIPPPVPTPEGEIPLHALVSLWVDAVDGRDAVRGGAHGCHATSGRLLGRRVALPRLRGQPVVGGPGLARWPAVSRGTDRCAPGAASRPDLRRVDHPVAHPNLADHRGDPAAHPLCPQRSLPWADRGAPPLAGIVEEAWPSLAHVTDPMLFYCADGDPDRLNAHVTQMIDEITAFVDLNTLRSVTMSEWILKS